MTPLRANEEYTLWKLSEWRHQQQPNSLRNGGELVEWLCSGGGGGVDGVSSVGGGGVGGGWLGKLARLAS